MKLFKWLISPLLVPLVGSAVIEAYALLRETLTLEMVQWLGAGALVYLFILPIVPKYNWTFLHTLEHELAHALTNALIGRRLEYLWVVTQKGGEVSSTGVVALGWFTGLAPYYLSLFTLPLLVVRSLRIEELRIVLDALIGFSLAFHMDGLRHEFTPQQPDIQKQTYLFAAEITILFNLLFLMLTLAVVSENWALFSEFLWRTSERAQLWYQEIIAYLQQEEIDLQWPEWVEKPERD
jgi:hypothetical protein